ncbi:MAG: hypothetical protein K2K82_00950 [Muribaculaceae bacterium]|nr:hypothetical protein [Muribaculaceae bacterium]
MKTELTIEESTKLIELGVDPKMASGESLVGGALFTLTDLLSILPKEIDGHHLNTDAIKEGYNVGYVLWDDDENWEAVISHFLSDGFFAPELIDALYQLLIYTITNNYVKTEKK